MRRRKSKSFCEPVASVNEFFKGRFRFLRFLEGTKNAFLKVFKTFEKFVLYIQRVQVWMQKHFTFQLCLLNFTKLTYLSSLCYIILPHIYTILRTLLFVIRSHVVRSFEEFFYKHIHNTLVSFYYFVYFREEKKL